MTARGPGGPRRWRAAALGALLAIAAPAAGAQNTACESGDDREVRSLGFEGNRAFTSRDLALRVATTPSNFWRRTVRVFGTRHCLNSDELRLDVGRLRAFYRRHGYYDATVDTAVAAQQDGAVRVKFLIREGDPILIERLRIAGLDSITAPIARPENLEIREGGVFDVTLLEAAIDSIKSRLRNNGYPRADVAASFDPNTTTHRAVVGLTVIPEARASIGPIRVTNEGVPGQAPRLGEGTLLKLIPLHTGDRYSARDLIDAQRTLYQSALFRRVDIRMTPDSLQPKGDTLVAIDVSLSEEFMRQIDTEAGWAELDCFKDRTHYVDKNFLGGARRLDLTAQVSKVGYARPTRLANGGLCSWKMSADSAFSSRLNYYAGAGLRFPTLFGLRTTPSVSLYTERRSEYKAYSRLTKVGAEAAMTREVAEGVPLRLGYSLEYGFTEAQPALFCAIFKACTLDRRQYYTRDRPVAVLSANVERVRVDNPFAPRSGTSLRFDVRGARRELGSSPDLQFVKGFGDFSWYRGLTRAVTLAVRARAGTVLGPSLSFSELATFIPPEERLYAGGSTSVRGFEQNELGDVIYLLGGAPNQIAGTADTVYKEVGSDSTLLATIPVGGTSLIVLNLELRFRSPFYSELLQFMAFADAGDVWERGLRPEAHKGSMLYLNALKWTPGVGMRVFTALGPLQVNLGYNPFPRPAGALYYISAPNVAGVAPLYCVSPGNRIPATPTAGPNPVYEQLPNQTCPATFEPKQQSSFRSHLKLSFSIGPDF